MSKPMYYVRDVHVWPSRWSNTRRQVNDWRVRLCAEAKYSYTYFGTLTLDEENLVRYPVPDVKLLQLVLKRFRQRLKRDLSYYGTLKYYWVSEYGENTHRLHYHILFMLSESVDVALLKYLLEKAWSYGFVQLDVRQNDGAILYATKYINKKFFERHAKSQSQGIGLKWYEVNRNYFIACLKSGKLPQCPCGRYMYAMPRFYRKKLFLEFPELVDVYHDIVKQYLEKKDFGHSILFATNSHVLRLLDTVNERLFFGLGSYKVRGVGLCDDVSSVLVDFGPLLGNYLLQHFSQEHYMSLFKRGLLSYQELLIRCK